MERLRDPHCDVALDRKRVPQLAIVLLGPQGLLRGGVDESGGDAYSHSSRTDPRDAVSGVRRDGAPAQQPQGREVRELAADLLRHPGGEVLLRRIRWGQIRIPLGAQCPSPELLFLDEPTAGVDPVTARQVRTVIRDTRDAGATIVITTHDMVTADELCDRVAFLIDGRIAAVDAPRALRLTGGHRRVRVETRRDRTRESHEFALEGLADDAAFRALLAAGGIETMHTLEPTLEDVFVRLTGRPLG